MRQPSRCLPEGFINSSRNRRSGYRTNLAVISAQEQLTYQQLNERANQLARVLQRRGVGPNVLVGLCMARSAHMLVGLLGNPQSRRSICAIRSRNPTCAADLPIAREPSYASLDATGSGTHLLEWGGKTLCLEELEQEMFQASAGNLPGGQ